MTLWLTARGTGLAALVLFTISTALGALGCRHRSGAAVPGNPGRRYIVQYVHRVSAGLGVVAMLLHAMTIVADSYAHVGWVGALVPFRAGYRPTWVGIGTLAGYCFLGVAALGFARGRMAASPTGARIWRGLHGLAYVGWGAAMLHGFTSGTDSAVPWVRDLFLGCLAVVLGAVGIRLARTAKPAALRRHIRPALEGASR
jgi:hypothetical protein